MARSLISIGVEVPGSQLEAVEFSQARSLHDADIVLIDPDFGSSWAQTFGSTYRGKPSLSDTASFELASAVRHWSSELVDAFKAGKTVFVFLSERREVFVDTGRREHSGTGRNAKTTRLVTELDSYQTLPFTLPDVRVHSGKRSRATSDIGPLASYWSSFAALSEYQASFDIGAVRCALATPGADRAVGGVIPVHAGHAVVLPPINFPEHFLSSYGDEEVWTDSGIKHGHAFIAAIVAIDKALRAKHAATPAPVWSQTGEYDTAAERSLAQDANRLSVELENLGGQLAALKVQIAEHGELKGLLYEKGKPLEAAVLSALRILGFAAEPFGDGDSEFDVVFTSPEGDFLGECEGRDNKAVNIDKLAQLERNIREDFARDSVTEHKHGVLFGNAFRLDPPGSRPECFTAKCMTGAKRAGVALVSTPDLFAVVRFLTDHADPSFARECRLAILQGAGAGTKVAFPSLPSQAPTG